MRRRRALGGIAAAVGVAWVAAWLWLGRGRPEVSLTTIMDRLSPGMSESDVAAILGPPTADVTGRLPAYFPPPAAGGRVLEYAGERATAGVEFGPDGRLVRAYPIKLRVITGPERVRSRLNLWW